MIPNEMAMLLAVMKPQVSTVIAIECEMMFGGRSRARRRKQRERMGVLLYEDQAHLASFAAVTGNDGGSPSDRYVISW